MYIYAEVSIETPEEDFIIDYIAHRKQYMHMNEEQPQHRINITRP